jgi:aminoglycoside phosphotransferase (APT) family kinase protein
MSSNAAISLLADVASRDRLAGWLASAVGANAVRIVRAERLAGGAVQENWGIDVEIDGGPRAGTHAWVLRSDAAARISVSLDRAAEFAVLQVAHAAGVAVAEPVARCADAAVIGRPFLVQHRVQGSAQARKLVRDPQLPTYGEALAERLGEELARIHSIEPPQAALSALPIPMLAPARVEVAKFRAALDNASEPRPALEYVLAWLDRNAPAARRVTLVHGDFRTGNYMVDGGKLSAVLDWEFAHWGDPDEDIGWLMARCWRFGNDGNEAGGIGARAAFNRSYQRIAGHPVDDARVAYWEIMAAAKWATIAVLQGDRFRKDGEPSIELALTGLMPPEMELDALDGIMAIEAAKGGRR